MMDSTEAPVSIAVELATASVRNILRDMPALDMTYVSRWAAELGIEALLKEVRQ